MKTIILKEKTAEVKITLKEYKEMRDKIIDNIMLNANIAYKKDIEMILGIKALCNHLYKASFNEVSVKLVRGLSGFLHWAVQNMQNNSWTLTNIIHDLGEFKRNKDEDWFCPRTNSYSKFL